MPRPPSKEPPKEPIDEVARDLLEQFKDKYKAASELRLMGYPQAEITKLLGVSVRDLYRSFEKAGQEGTGNADTDVKDTAANTTLDKMKKRMVNRALSEEDKIYNLGEAFRGIEQKAIFYNMTPAEYVETSINFFEKWHKTVVQAVMSGDLQSPEIELLEMVNAE
jgi:hypothetical protein